MVDVLILCAIPVEWRALRTLISDTSSDSVLSDPCLLGDMTIAGNVLRVALVETGMGTTNASLATHAATERLSPTLVIYAGIAGGVKDVALGDVAIASKVYYYESGKTADGRFLPRPEAYQTPHRLATIGREIAHQDRENFKVFFGAIASGEKVLADVNSSQVGLLKESYGDTLAVEMEGAGFMQACLRGSTSAYLMVRGVSDLIEGKTQADDDGGQERASINLATVVGEVIARFFKPVPTALNATSKVEAAPTAPDLGIPRPTPNETYVLLAPAGSKVAEAVVQSGLPLTLVLDLDPETDRAGLLCRSRESLAGERPVHLMTADDPLVASRNSVSWIAVRGLDECEDLRSWKRGGRRRLRETLAEFAAVSGVRHANVIVAADATVGGDWMGPILDDILTEFGDAVNIVALGSQLTELEVDSRIAAEPDAIARGLSTLLRASHRAEAPSLPCKTEPNTIEIPRDQAAWLEEDLELVGIHPPKGDSEAAALDFLRGGIPSWVALEGDSDVLRTTYGPWRKSLEGVLKNRRTLRVNLFHEPGAGGTTLARRAAFDLRLAFPTVVLARFRTQETSRRLDYIARTTELPVLAIIDTASVTDAEVNDLMEELHASSTPTLVVYVSRRYSALPVESKATFLLEALDDAEADGFFDTLRARAPWNVQQLSEIRDSRDYRRNAFFFGLSAFESDFKGIDQYVGSRLVGATEKQVAAIKYCSLAHYYGQTEIPEYALAALVGLPPGRASAFSRVLTPEMRQLMWRSPEGGWRTTHPLVAKHVLIHLGGGERWNQMLSTWGRELGEFCLDRAPQNRDLKKIVEAIFIEREGLQGSEAGPRATFAKILEDIPAPTGAAKLIGQISSLAGDDPHFAAHAARYYAFKLRDFATAARFAEQARELDPEDHVLQHVVGMVHRARVSDAIGQRLSLDEITPWVKAAASAFDASRRCAPNSKQHPYISEIQMRIAVVDYGVRRSGSIAAYLAGAPHPLVVESISVAEDLLARVRYLGDARNPSGYEERARGELTALYGDYERALQLFESLLGKRDVDPLPVRRQIVWTQLARARRDWRSLNGKASERVLSLLEQNMQEGGYSSADVRQWWRAIRYSGRRIPQDRVHEVLTYWRESELGSEALYASYVAQAVDLLDGLQSGREDYERFKAECSARSRRDGKRSLCLDWVGHGEGIGKLVHQSELGPWDPRTEFWSDHSLLRRLEARVELLKGPQAGTVVCHGIEAFFVPSRAGLEKGRDEKALVSGYLAFSNDGPRFWDPALLDQPRT
ncbi:5'-methylthioadenosine/S-adenosylhomocysteine nucleosidase [Arthrobacter sp. 1P04PC]|uniref:5'-methylthioadenosine/S-adenosylhomocysteine nucleosidase family protein n=1 Tax=unclassified Arthrobacter TaxID=235627 RepID=UPI00399FE23E